MRRSSQATRLESLSMGIVLVLGLLAAPAVASGQGCMPLRFTSANLGGQQAPFLMPHQWQIGIAGRRVASNRFFKESHEDEALAPGGQPLHLRLNTVDVSATYATSERFSLTLSLPLSHSTADNVYPDFQYHQVSSTGVGDINVTGNFWLGAPTQHPKSNVQVGLGVKVPTGRNHVLGNFYDPQGNISRVPLSQTLQLGDGGWSVLVQGQGFRQLLPRASAYLTGFYSVSLRQHTDVIWPPANTFWAVPDVYTARAGLSYNVKEDLSVSLGGRVDGTPTSDLLGGRTDFFRHAGFTAYVDPGLSLQLGPNAFTLNVPVRVRHTYLDMLINNGQDVRVGTGGVADYVIYLSYSRRM